MTFINSWTSSYLFLRIFYSRSHLMGHIDTNDDDKEEKYVHVHSNTTHLFFAIPFTHLKTQQKVGWNARKSVMPKAEENLWHSILDIFLFAFKSCMVLLRRENFLLFHLNHSIYRIVQMSEWVRVDFWISFSLWILN